MYKLTTPCSTFSDESILGLFRKLPKDENNRVFGAWFYLDFCSMFIDENEVHMLYPYTGGS